MPERENHPLARVPSRPVQELRLQLARFFDKSGDQGIDAFVVGKAIRHALERQSRRDLHGDRYVPNELLVFLHPRDFMVINQERFLLEKQLPGFVRGTVQELGMTIYGRFMPEIVMDQEGVLGPGEVWIRTSYNPHVEDLDPTAARNPGKTLRIEIGAEPAGTREHAPESSGGRPRTRASTSTTPTRASSLGLRWSEEGRPPGQQVLAADQRWTLGRRKPGSQTERLVEVSHAAYISGRHAAVHLDSKTSTVTVFRYSGANPVTVLTPDGRENELSEGKDWLGKPPFSIWLSYKVTIEVSLT